MAIFTAVTKFTDKYFEAFDKAINSIPKDEIIEQLQVLFNQTADEVMSIYGDEELKNYGFTEKFDFTKHKFRLDFQKYIEVILDRYQDENCNLTADIETIDKAMQVVLKPLYDGDAFFYSRMLRQDGTLESFLNIQNNAVRKIVEKMEDK